MADVIKWIVFIGSIVGGLYVGGWVMFIQPILEACKCFDAGTLTGTMVGITVLKCMFAGFVTSVIIRIGVSIAKAINALYQ